MLNEKQCSACKQMLIADNFYKSKTSKSGLTSQCKSCAKQWQKNNKDKRAKICKKYMESDSAKAKKRAWTIENRDRINKRSNELRTEKRWAERERKPPVTRKESVKKYYKSNKEKFCNQRAIRRAITRQATPLWANQQKILKIYRLQKRLNSITPRKYHVDHIVPLNSKLVCGLHNEFNLRIVDSKENLSKSNKTWPNMP